MTRVFIGRFLVAMSFRDPQQKHGGRFLVKGDAAEALEGGRQLPNLVVILEFPSLEHARRWYHDPDYVPLIKLRQTGSDAELILVEGLA